MYQVLLAAVLGVALAYYLDPEAGPRRRDRTIDALITGGQMLKRGTLQLAKYTRDGGSGLLHYSPGGIPDLVDRTRAQALRMRAQLGPAVKGRTTHARVTGAQGNGRPGWRPAPAEGPRTSAERRPPAILRLASNTGGAVRDGREESNRTAAKSRQSARPHVALALDARVQPTGEGGWEVRLPLRAEQVRLARQVVVTGRVSPSDLRRQPEAMAGVQSRV